MSKSTFDRQYLGVTITAQNYREILKEGGRALINYHTKHLRAYLKGNDMFSHGFRLGADKVTRFPAWHKVQEKLTALESIGNNPKD